MKNNCGFGKIGDGEERSCNECEAYTEKKCPLLENGGRSVRGGIGLGGCRWDDDIGCKAVAWLKFGGSRHGFGSFGLRTRPEDIHAEICPDSGKCTECDQRSACWHGRQARSSGASALMQVKVPANTKLEGSLAFTLWVECKDVGGKWTIELPGGHEVSPTEQLTNGAIEVLVDGVKLDPGLTTTGEIPPLADCHKGRPCTAKGVKQALDLQRGNHHVQVIFHIADVTQDSSAGVKIEAQIDPWVDVCLSTHLCLAKLARGNAAFRLRNNNTRQHLCLQGHPEEEDAALCSRWAKCLTSEESNTVFLDALKNLLSAAQSNTASGPRKLLSVSQSSTDSGTVRTERIADAPGCVDPHSADTEAFECECLSDLQQTCSSGATQEDCFRNLMCEHPDVCCSWKDLECPEPVHCQTGERSSMLASALKRTTEKNGSIKAMLTRQKGQEDADLSGSLDGSLGGKCTSESQ